MPHLVIPCQIFPSHVTACQMMPNFGKYPKISSIPFSSRRVYPNLANSCQILPNIATSGQLFFADMSQRGRLRPDLASYIARSCRNLVKFYKNIARYRQIISYLANPGKYFQIPSNISGTCHTLPNLAKYGPTWSNLVRSGPTL